MKIFQYILKTCIFTLNYSTKYITQNKHHYRNKYINGLFPDPTIHPLFFL